MAPLPELPRQASAYLGAERTTCHVTVYNRTAGVAVFRGKQTLDFSGPKDHAELQLESLSLQNALAQGGSFNFTLWAPEGVDVCRRIEVDAWVDISLCRGSVCWHVMRGMVDEVRQSRQVGGAGTTQIAARVLGRSFQKAWETTPAWFNQLTASNYLGAQLRQVSATGLINGDPTTNVQAVLLRYFEVIGSLGRSNWAMPTAMPGRGGSLTHAVLYDDTGFDAKNLARQTPTGNMFFPDSHLWEVAMQQYGDMMFCELYTDILPPGGMRALAKNPKQAAGLSPKQSRMAVVYRDKPFPRVDPACQGPLGRKSPWFSLPLWQLSRQEVMSLDMGTSSLEALNAFMCVGNFFGEDQDGFGTLRSPLWSVPDMQRRGMRRLDSASPYVNNQNAGTTKQMLFYGRRARLRDWYCLGAELRSGSVNLWRCHPEIKVGGRLRVLGGTPSEDQTAYIEVVRHDWSAVGGAQTACDVTRTWVGTDDALLARLAKVSGQYTIGPSRPS